MLSYVLEFILSRFITVHLVCILLIMLFIKFFFVFQMQEGGRDGRGRPKIPDDKLSAAARRKRESRARQSETKTDTERIDSRVRSTAEYTPRSSLIDDEYIWEMAVLQAKKDNRCPERIR